jgi:hypothetical protein
VTLLQKQQQFNTAMERYHSRKFYRGLTRAVSVINTTLQLYLLCRIWSYSIGAVWQIFVLLAAYLAADFINGLVHMFMDNNERYDSFAGPFIANFHLHHKTPQYRKNNLLVVYFNENGSKIWLVPYLMAVSVGQLVFTPDPVVVHLLVYIGIFSSVAEVSHYLCHSSTSPLSMFLGTIGVLLSKKHHAEHHLNDNTHYAFLNGWTDSLLNLIALRCYKGYKETSDLHFAGYFGENSKNR